MEQLLQLLIGILGFLIFLILVFVVIYFLLLRKKSTNNETSGSETIVQSGNTATRSLAKEDIKAFMNFDEVKDNMIIRNGRTQYLMVVQCKGINYDLLSEEEKIAVEEGFVQFLNTLRFPIQLYVQTKSLNFEDIIDQYTEKIRAIENDIKTIERKMRKAEIDGDKEEFERLQFELKRKNNVLEYGADITNYVNKLSLNKNILKQKTYIIVSYYTSEFSGAGKIDEEEADNIYFSELYTRTKLVVRAIASAGVKGKILDSDEISELLYVAYNRDDADMLTFNKALEGQYDRLYSTGKDVLKKKQELMDEKIEEEAVELVTSSIKAADQKMAEEDKELEERIMKRAIELTEQHKAQMSDRLYKNTVEQIKEKAKRGRPAKKKETA